MICALSLTPLFFLPYRAYEDLIWFAKQRSRRFLCQFLNFRDLPNLCEPEAALAYMTCHLIELTSKKTSSKIKRQKEERDEDGFDEENLTLTLALNFKRSKISSCNKSSNSSSSGSNSNSNSSSLINPIGRDLSTSCLLHCSRSDYGSLASLNSGFRSLIRTGELYRLRRLSGIVEHWIYFSCNVLEWDVYDPFRRRWMTLPRMPHNECFVCSDKESLAVGTELLVFGKEIFNIVVLRYSILTNSWSAGVEMNLPRCLFGSASFGEKAFVAGGTDMQGNILSSAEMYNSETQTWVTLPSMKKPRRMCSGVYMDNKFYVLGGMSSNSNTDLLTCGEVYDIENGTWRVIDDMAAGLNGASGAPPLVAVVNNQLYAAIYGDKEVRKYNKESNTWVTLGRLPERPDSVNGWGIAFRACGDRLVVIGGPRVLGGGMIELHAWVPRDDGPLVWEMMDSKHSANFVYNCAVMGC